MNEKNPLDCGLWSIDLVFQIADNLCEIELDILQSVSVSGLHITDFHDFCKISHRILDVSYSIRFIRDPLCISCSGL